MCECAKGSCIRPNEWSFHSGFQAFHYHKHQFVHGWMKANQTTNLLYRWKLSMIYSVDSARSQHIDHWPGFWDCRSSCLPNCLLWDLPPLKGPKAGETCLSLFVEWEEPNCCHDRHVFVYPGTWKKSGGSSHRVLWDLFECPLGKVHVRKFSFSMPPKFLSTSTGCLQRLWCLYSRHSLSWESPYWGTFLYKNTCATVYFIFWSRQQNAKKLLHQ